MQTLLREWINEKKQKSVNYTMFGKKIKSFLRENYDADTAMDIYAELQYETWVT